MPLNSVNPELKSGLFFKMMHPELISGKKMNKNGKAKR